MEKLLIVEDSEDIKKQLRWGLGREHEVLFAGNADECLGLFRKHHPKVVMLDLGLPPHDEGAEEGIRCLEHILSEKPSTKVIVVTGNEDRDNALRAVQLGAYDYYRKPIDLKELRVIISRAYHLYGLEQDNLRLRSAIVRKAPGFGDMVGQCPEMQEVFSTIRKVASSDAPILVAGESGTGKELVAKAIHGDSLRRDRPFIPINCGAIPENLLESELFGHEKGAFTGAHAQLQGKVEYADRGTLFLDEIGELTANLQVKLLRFLQEKTIQRVGGREDISVDARIIAATNTDITSAIEQGTFREDLYYRVGVININLPPLRKRKGDVMLLANLFLVRFSEALGKKVRGFSPSAVERLESYGWPGNVRELENRVQRAVIMCESPIMDTGSLGFEGKTVSHKNHTLEPMPLKEAREGVERDMIILAIEKHEGNIAKTAETLGVSRPTLYDLMRKHGLHNLSATDNANT